MIKRLSLSAALIIFSFLFSSSSFAVVEGYIDYIHIKKPPRAIFLNVSESNSLGVFPGVCTDDTCYMHLYPIKKWRDKIMVTVGEDPNHSCQLIFSDGSYMSNPSLSKTICNGGYTCDGKLHHKFRSHTYTMEIRGPHLNDNQPESDDENNN